MASLEKGGNQGPANGETAQKELDARFRSAVEQGQWGKAAKMLRSGANGRTLCDGLAPLAAAMRSRDAFALAFARELLEGGADPRAAFAFNPHTGFYAKVTAIPASAATMAGNLDGLALLAEFGAFNAPRADLLPGGLRAAHSPWGLVAGAEIDQMLPVAKALMKLDPIGWQDRVEESGNTEGRILAELAARSALHQKERGLKEFLEAFPWPAAGPERGAAQAEALAKADNWDSVQNSDGGKSSKNSARKTLELAIARQEADEIEQAANSAEGAAQRAENGAGQSAAKHGRRI